MTGNKMEISFDHGEDTIGFFDGILGACAYSYQIDSFGSITLTEEETRKLYLTMAQYYKQQGE